MTLLVANRGEIALRVIRTATELGLDTVAVYAEDDAECPHVHAATRAVALRGVGPAAYLDQDAVLAAAGGCTLVHPGYGFLAENAEFASACADAGLIFVGPSPQLLRRFGDKSAARDAAIGAQVPVLAATDGASTLAQVRQFLATQPAGVMLKALAGGGGRGMRPVRAESELDDAYRSCAAEAQLGFGRPDLFAEALCEGARHIEVQIVAAPGADGHAVALALGDRDCSVQRRHQKLVEVAPAQHLDAALRRQLHEAAARLCASVGYRGLATVEFLVTDEQFVFLEVNPRIQVEHTITEEVTGVDLVAVQLAIAQDVAFADLDLPEGVTATGTTTSGRPARAAGIAIQTRVNLETLQADGQVLPAAGTLITFASPTGPGVRVDTFGRPGLTPSPRYDSLLAKVITHTAGGFAAAARKAGTALEEFVIKGIETNIPLLRKILADNDFRAATVTTAWLGERLGDLVPTTAASQQSGSDDGTVRAQLGGIVIEVAATGSKVAVGAQLAVLEAMKMQHVVLAPADVEIRRTLVAVGQTVGAGAPLMLVTHLGRGTAGQGSTVDLDRERADLAEIRSRHHVTLDAARLGAVEKRRKLARRTARENITDLVDDGSFVEYGPLVLAAQRSRRSEQDLIENTPADGLVGGTATIDAADAVVISYDYTVLVGTQGMRNHAKTDRLLDVAARKRVPVVLFAEGG
ncbi:MAG: biotin carboxylase N-terminal domain-containing protein, partial [Mycobacteriaceae bacterium]